MPSKKSVDKVTYTLKMRIYPNEAQKKKIDAMIHALHIAYNITFHEVFQKNPLVCSEPKENGSVWPDFDKMANAAWIHKLYEINPSIKEAEAPASSLESNIGLFLSDAKRAWKMGMGNLPIDKVNRKDFHFYSKAEPRLSFSFQMPAKNLIVSEDNPKVAWIIISKKVGKIKARGFNSKLRFGDDFLTFNEALSCGMLNKKLTVKISRDRCDDYYTSITMPDFCHSGVNPVSKSRTEVGLDVGIKNIATLSDGTEIENKHFKKKYNKKLCQYNRQLSRRWGPSNLSFRDYNKSIKNENRRLPEEKRQPLATASKRYLKTKRNKARLERRIARQRDTYYHQQTGYLVQNYSTIAVETLRVKNMMRNHKLASALSDAAMSDFISKLTYKSKRSKIKLLTIGTFEPSSQLCSVCNYQNTKVKNLGIREWVCPQCNTKHNRDVNAAKNILAIALSKGSVSDDEITIPAKKKKKSRSGPDKVNIIMPDRPNIVVQYSKELTTRNNPRYVIYDKNTQSVVDDAQGSGYRSVANAKNCYKSKRKHSLSN